MIYDIVSDGYVSLFMIEFIHIQIKILVRFCKNRNTHIIGIISTKDFITSINYFITFFQIFTEHFPVRDKIYVILYPGLLTETLLPDVSPDRFIDLILLDYGPVKRMFRMVQEEINHIQEEPVRHLSLLRTYGGVIGETFRICLPFYIELLTEFLE